ncbi:MAG: putative metal-binding motif-containing protein [Myxococcota bacterium]
MLRLPYLFALLAVATALAALSGCKDDLGLGSVVFECASQEDCASGYLCRVDGSLGRSVCLAEGSIVEPVEGLNLVVTSEAPAAGSLTAVRAIFATKDGGTLTHWPSSVTDVHTSIAVSSSFAPVPGPANWRLNRATAPFPEGSMVDAMVVGVTASGIATLWMGKLDFSSNVPQSVHLERIALACDTDKDGFSDCGKTGCCGGAPTSPLSDCAPGAGDANPFATEDPCAQCGDGVDQDCSGGDAVCVDADKDGVADCRETTCGAGDPKVAPGLPEVCDSVDQDCDGATDEGFALGGDCGEGACAGGKVECGPDGMATQCSSASNATAEICGNSIDDNCDGGTDEGCSEHDLDGDGFGSDTGDCNDADSGVYPGAAEPCCSRTLQGQPNALALCDKNCDEAVAFCTATDADEDGFSPPEDCDDGNAAIYPGAPEPCGDGVDQDCSGADLTCDGLVDADKDGFSAEVDCDDGDNTRYPGAPEVCDGVDQDCDGQTDEGNPGTNGGEPCGESAGACVPGKRVCVNSDSDGLEPGMIACVGGTGPVEETCDGVDNDCNGTTDEAFLVGGQPVGAACDGGGACGEGVVECATATSARCSTSPGGSQGGGAGAETCNGVDDDCDGTIDEGLTDVADSDCLVVGVCAAVDAGGKSFVTASCRVDPDPPSSFGWDCDYSAVEGYSVDEAGNCDALDNDCDGETDDGLELGTGCDGDDADSCDNGTLICTEDGSAVVCDETGASVAVESCDGKDNDCDNATDEDFKPGGTVTFDGGPFAGDAGKGVGDACGAGLCAGGVVECKTGSPQALKCSSSGKAVAEKCNGKDDDCDGKTDEAFPVGSACGIGMCAGGVVECGSNGGTRCSSMPAGVAQGEAGSASKAVAELCNSKDDDCDGKSDEDLTSVVDAGCSTKGVCGGDGVASATCSGGKWTCSYAGPDYQAAGELGRCDLLDNDCDGDTDEDFGPDGTVVYPLPGGGKAVLGAACGVGACDEGAVVCSPNGAALVCTSSDTGSPEICNGIDDDCDGSTDEDPVAGPSSQCSTLGVCAAAGALQIACDDGAEVCIYSGTDYQKDDELGRCDGLDNDCDGDTDEDFLPGGTVLFEDISGKKISLGEACGAQECGGGVVECAEGGQVLQCVENSVGNEDICNGKDDDCDGVTDGPFSAGGVVSFDGGPYASDAGAVLADSCGTGACAGGLVICADPMALTCDTLGAAATEQCNSVDDDCDGETDETFVEGGGKTYDGGPFAGDAGKTLGQACGVGACAGGVVVCNPNDATKLTCSTLTNAVAELCDAVDNDCDGKTDEIYKTGGTVTYDGGPLPTQAGRVLGETCGTGGCSGGIVVCNAADKTKLTCSSISNVKTETCDAVDQDCDGQTDEDFKPTKGLIGWLQPYAPFGVRFLGETCGTGKCKGGFVVCSAVGGLDCPTMMLATPDTTCNDIDDDCDGSTDDAFIAGGNMSFVDWDGAARVKGQSCGRGACVGSVVCDTASALRCNGPAPSPDTSCDGVDQDCDGDFDEDFAEAPCDSGGDGCARGVSLCSGGAVACDGDSACPAQQPFCEHESADTTDNCLCTITIEGGDSCTNALGVGWACLLADGTCQTVLP